MTSKRPPPPRRPLSRGAMICSRVPEELKASLEDVALASGKTVTQLVESGIRRELKWWGL